MINRSILVLLLVTNTSFAGDLKWLTTKPGYVDGSDQITLKKTDGSSIKLDYKNALLGERLRSRAPVVLSIQAGGVSGFSGAFRIGNQVYGMVPQVGFISMTYAVFSNTYDYNSEPFTQDYVTYDYSANVDPDGGCIQLWSLTPVEGNVDVTDDMKLSGCNGGNITFKDRNGNAVLRWSMGYTGYWYSSYTDPNTGNTYSTPCQYYQMNNFSFLSSSGWNVSKRTRVGNVMGACGGFAAHIGMQATNSWFDVAGIELGRVKFKWYSNPQDAGSYDPAQQPNPGWIYFEDNGEKLYVEPSDYDDISQVYTDIVRKPK